MENMPSFFTLRIILTPHKATIEWVRRKEFQGVTINSVQLTVAEEITT